MSTRSKPPEGAGPRLQRLVFGEVAELYDEARPSYPPALLSDVLEHAHLGRGEAIVEIGAGTGKASVLVAPHVAANGWSLTCLEPDASMASLCRHNLEKSSGVEVLEVGFEEYVDGPRAHDPPALVFAAQSWHWVDPTRRCDLVADLLAPGGTLGLIWNVSHQPDADLQAQIDAAYGKAVPDNLPWQPPRCGRGPSAGSAGSDRSAGRRLLGEDMVDYRRELDASGRFGQVELAERPWTRRYTTSQWLSLLSTHSNHRLLDEETLAAVLERIGAVVDKTGGELTIEYTAVALLTRSLVPA